MSKFRQRSFSHQLIFTHAWSTERATVGPKLNASRIAVCVYVTVTANIVNPDETSCIEPSYIDLLYFSV